SELKINNCREPLHLDQLGNDLPILLTYSKVNGQKLGVRIFIGHGSIQLNRLLSQFPEIRSFDKINHLMAAVQNLGFERFRNKKRSLSDPKRRGKTKIRGNIR